MILNAVLDEEQLKRIREEMGKNETAPVEPITQTTQSGLNGEQIEQIRKEMEVEEGTNDPFNRPSLPRPKKPKTTKKKEKEDNVKTKKVTLPNIPSLPNLPNLPNIPYQPNIPYLPNSNDIKIKPWDRKIINEIKKNNYLDKIKNIEYNSKIISEYMNKKEDYISQFIINNNKNNNLEEIITNYSPLEKLKNIYSLNKKEKDNEFF